MLGNSSMKSASQCNQSDGIHSAGFTNAGQTSNNNNNVYDKANNNNNIDEIDHTIDMASDFFMDLSDLDEMRTLTDADLGLLADPNKVRMLSEALQLSPPADMSMPFASHSIAAKNGGASRPMMNEMGQTGSHYASNNIGDEMSQYSPKTDTASSITSNASSEMMYANSNTADSQTNLLNLNDNNNSKLCQNNNLIGSSSLSQQNNSGDTTQAANLYDQQQMPPPPLLPPIVISPAEVDNISVQLEKNQQCACKDCGKLFNSVWYLKQHAVKHSNDRPFKCKFCLKTYKFRSNLYQHKCPERNRHFGGIGQSFRKRLYTRGIAYTELYNKAMANHKANGGNALDNFESLGKPQRNRDSLSSASSSTSSALMSPSSAGFKGNFNFEALSANSHMGDTQISETEMAANSSMQIPIHGQNSAENNNGFDLFPQYTNDQRQNYQSQPQVYGSSKTNANGDGNSAYSESMMTGCSGLQQTSNSLQDESLVPPFFRMNTGVGPSSYMNEMAACPSMFHANCAECCFGGEPLGAMDSGCIRDTPLEQEYIDSYIQKNRSRVYPCRKCKLSFPSREYLDRHIAYHNTIECEPYVCDQCPQRFANEKLLQSHFLQHSDNSPHKCLQCFGVFRSALALRRHKDQCRQCYCPPFGMYSKLMVSPSAPLDPYGFVESEDEIEKRAKSAELYHQQNLLAQQNCAENRNNNDESILSGQCGSNNNFYNSELTIPSAIQKHSTVSVGASDCSAYSFTTSSNRANTLIDEALYDRCNSYAFNADNSTIKGEIMGEEKNESSAPAKGIEEEDEEEEDQRAASNNNNSKMNKNKNSRDTNHPNQNYPYPHNFYNRMLHHQTSNGSAASSKYAADDETDSGFRSRLDSVVTAHSYSPPASSSSSTTSATSSASSTGNASPHMHNSAHSHFGDGEKHFTSATENITNSTLALCDKRSAKLNYEPDVGRDSYIKNVHFNRINSLQLYANALISGVFFACLRTVTDFDEIESETFDTEERWEFDLEDQANNQTVSARRVRLPRRLKKEAEKSIDSEALVAARRANPRALPAVSLHENSIPNAQHFQELRGDKLLFVLLLQEYIRRANFLLNTMEMLKLFKIPKKSTMLCDDPQAEQPH